MNTCYKNILKNGALNTGLFS